MSGGRAFVLFTSYRLMGAVAEELEDFFEDEDIRLLVQGQKMPRHQLIQEFRDDITSVLFGTDSFWTGVDVPGEALSNVIVTRLPFAVPDHPLVASQLERIEAEGGNPFVEYSVPEAILKLRQGVGRLIRSGRDEGITVILGSRESLTKRYGRAFLNALPARRSRLSTGLTIESLSASIGATVVLGWCHEEISLASTVGGSGSGGGSIALPKLQPTTNLPTGHRRWRVPGHRAGSSIDSTAEPDEPDHAFGFDSDLSQPRLQFCLV